MPQANQRRTKRSTIVAEAKHFVKEVAARLSQDEDKVISESNARIAIQSIKGQCAALDLKLMKAETANDLAIVELGNAKYPTKAIKDPDAYITKIKDCELALQKSVEDIEEIERSLDYFEAMLDEFAGTKEKK
jgi:hypothetical protein